MLGVDWQIGLGLRWFWFLRFGWFGVWWFGFGCCVGLFAIAFVLICVQVCLFAFLLCVYCWFGFVNSVVLFLFFLLF